MKYYLTLLLILSGFPAFGEVVTGWYEYKPARQADERLVLSLADIESHMPRGGHIYTALDDHVNWSHETTHAVNSAIRNQVGGGTNAFYCLNDKAFVLREPRVRKSQVCAFVPVELRGSGWGLYMAGQQEWDDTPLYILDEWSAYLNGAMTHTELLDAGARQGRSYQADVAKCVEFAGYAKALVAAVDRIDPNYPDREKLVEFVAYQTARAGDLSNAPQFANERKVYEQFFCPNGQCWRPAQRQQIVTRPAPAPQPPVAPVRPVQPVVQSKPCQCDPTLSARIKVIEQKISAFEASIEAGQVAGKPGKDGRDGKDAEPIDLDALAAKLADKVGCKCKPQEPAPQPNKERHVVIVADQASPTWYRLRSEIESAQHSFSGIRIADPPKFSIQLPQIVVYEDRIPIRVIAGARPVSDVLVRVARGESSFFEGVKNGS